MSSILYISSPKTGTIVVNKTIIGAPEDMTVFRVTLTGQSAEPTIVGPFDLNQEAPAICRNLPFDTYVITEEVQAGYTQTSVHDPIVLTRANRNQSVTVVNEVVVPIKYGALYNWYALAGIAPSGWHVPSKIEWEALIANQGGDTVASGHLKETGTINWIEEHADNSTGFNGRGSGHRGSNGIFIDIKNDSYFWSAYNGGGYSYSYILSATTTSLACAYISNKYGCSLRLLLDSPETWAEGDTVTDIDGNVYPTVKIGDQVWTAANWACTKLADGTPIPNVTDNAAWVALTTKGYCWYDNNIDNK